MDIRIISNIKTEWGHLKVYILWSQIIDRDSIPLRIFLIIMHIRTFMLEELAHAVCCSESFVLFVQLLKMRSGQLRLTVTLTSISPSSCFNSSITSNPAVFLA